MTSLRVRRLVVLYPQSPARTQYSQCTISGGSVRKITEGLLPVHSFRNVGTNCLFDKPYIRYIANNNNIIVDRQKVLHMQQMNRCCNSSRK